MKERLFVDSDIILDIAVNREPFFASSSQLMGRIELNEDAIQYYAAVRNKMDQLITRNTKHFIRSDISVHTPEEFLRLKKIKDRVG